MQPLSDVAFEPLDEVALHDTQRLSEVCMTPSHGIISEVTSVQLVQPVRPISQANVELVCELYVDARWSENEKALTEHTRSATRQPPRPMMYCPKQTQQLQRQHQFTLNLPPALDVQ